MARRFGCVTWAVVLLLTAGCGEASFLPNSKGARIVALDDERSLNAWIDTLDYQSDPRTRLDYNDRYVRFTYRGRVLSEGVISESKVLLPPPGGEGTTYISWGPKKSLNLTEINDAWRRMVAAADSPPSGTLEQGFIDIAHAYGTFQGSESFGYSPRFRVLGRKMCLDLTFRSSAGRPTLVLFILRDCRLSDEPGK